jgi:LPXTG-site transpeptidase (sortase) family protein
VNTASDASRVAVPAAPGVVPALVTIDLTTTQPDTSGAEPHDVPGTMPTLPAITAPGADAGAITPVAVPTGVVPQMPTTGKWGLPLDQVRFLPGLDRLSKPPALPLPQGVEAVARLVIPSLGVDSPVVPAQPQIGLALDGSLRLVWNIPDYAAGWHADSMPLGQAGNAVISGHNNVGSQVFRQLEEAHVGDPIYVQIPGGPTYLYTIRQVLVLPEDGQPESVRIANARYLQPTADTRLTLVSCWPDWSNTERVVVVALP